MSQLIADAIKQKNIIQFNYHNHLRIVEPHVLGISKGHIEVEGYQIGGSSSTGILPNWRRFSLEDISDYQSQLKYSRVRELIPQENTVALIPLLLW
jgi:predicted DNA-binding transcriptional regulator YafY